MSMTITPDETPDIKILLACSALADSGVYVHFYNGPAYLHYATIESVDLLSGFITTDSGEGLIDLHIKEITRLEIF